MELSGRFASGGEAELEEVVRVFGERLVRYAASVLFNRQDAEDVVQEVFLYAYQNRARFDGRNLSAWLYKITYRDCLDRLKRRKVLFFFDVKEEPAMDMQDGLLMHEITEALKPLSPKERALLYGRIIDGHSYDQLAQIIGATPSALRKQYERAKKKAAKYLDGFTESRTQLEPCGIKEGSRF
ncbi:MAG: sigma-70 family RNA polymerase sigma factor [Defluviitaleaceae bacterium]|nr:sigma-70 family RNA polymerase sigma factor [Defluviitaleaceae bacterium]